MLFSLPDPADDEAGDEPMPLLPEDEDPDPTDDALWPGDRRGKQWDRPLFPPALTPALLLLLLLLSIMLTPADMGTRPDDDDDDSAPPLFMWLYMAADDDRDEESRDDDGAGVVG